MDTCTARSIDPELMNLRGALAPAAPLEDLARYGFSDPPRIASAGSIPPVAFDDDALPALPFERAPRWPGRALAVAASAFAMVCVARALPVDHVRALPMQAGVASLDAAPVIGRAPAPLPASAPRDETIIVLPTTTIVASIARVAPTKPRAPMTAPAEERPVTSESIPTDFPEPVDPRAALAQLPDELDRAAAAIAISAAARGAARCLDDADGTSSMPARVTFAPSGRVTSATIEGGPFVGTPVGGCIAATLRSASVGAFQGGPVTVSTTIRVR